MFALNKITITNFRSYKGTHEFEFPKKSGLYYFTGKNLVEDLGANGAGKTTFMDAITWCLYGLTTRGLKATDVLTDWETPGCAVELNLTVGEQTSVVKRTQKPNNLTLDGKMVDQKELEAFLRLNYHSFLHSILNAQFGVSFFSLTSSNKLSLFSDIMGLDNWLRLSKKAAEESAAIQLEIDELKEKINKKKGHISSLEETIEELEPKVKEFDVECVKKINALDAFNALLEVESRKIRKEIGQVLYHITEREKELSKTKNKLNVIEDRQNELLDYISKANGRKQEVEDQKKSIVGRLAKLNKQMDCPLCEQPVTDTVRNHFSTSEERLDRKIIIHEEAVKELTRKITAMRINHHEAQRTHNFLTNDLHDLDVELRRQELALSDNIKLSAEHTRKIKDLEGQENPYTDLLKTKRSQLNNYKLAVAADKQTLQSLEFKHAATSYWIKGFKRVRLYLIEQAFNSLELEVNNCLSQLGMQEWEITFDIERENKSGSMTKGFMVFVQSPRNTKPVKWENWSGGETQRLQLAGDLGLANLIMLQAGLTNTIEFYDEPSTHLSTEGMMDLANMLYERAITDEKTIWIVDHAAVSNFGEFESIITVRKDSNGSTVTQK